MLNLSWVYICIFKKVSNDLIINYIGIGVGNKMNVIKYMILLWICLDK